MGVMHGTDARSTATCSEMPATKNPFPAKEVAGIPPIAIHASRIALRIVSCFDAADGGVKAGWRGMRDFCRTCPVRRMFHRAVPFSREAMHARVKQPVMPQPDVAGGARE